MLLKAIQTEHFRTDPSEIRKHFDNILYHLMKQLVEQHPSLQNAVKLPNWQSDLLDYLHKHFNDIPIQYGTPMMQTATRFVSPTPEDISDYRNKIFHLVVQRIERIVHRIELPSRQETLKIAAFVHPKAKSKNGGQLIEHPKLTP